MASPKSLSILLQTYQAMFNQRHNQVQVAGGTILKDGKGSLHQEGYTQHPGDVHISIKSSAHTSI